VVSNAAGNATSALEFIFVTAAVKSPTDITSFITAGAQVGVPFSYTIVSSGGTTPITFDASPLPAWLSVNTGTGVISGTPPAVGTNSIGLIASNSAGNTTATLVLTVTTNPPPITIDAWRWANFGVAAINPAITGDAADPDDDGVKNLLEYSTGTNPLAPDPTPWSLTITNDFLTATAIQNPHATGITWSAESSGDLALWYAADTTVLRDTNSLFQARDNYPFSANSHRFLRLKIMRP
jgi:hypothetical protein